MIETDEEQYDKHTGILRIVAYGVAPIAIVALIIGIAYLGIISFS